jgi:hypothetical protein
MKAPIARQRETRSQAPTAMHGPSRRRPLPIPAELRALIRKMTSKYLGWGEGRIAYELRVKLGIRVSARSADRYMPKDKQVSPVTISASCGAVTFLHES